MLAKATDVKEGTAGGTAETDKSEIVGAVPNVGPTGTEGDVQLGTPSVASLVNSAADAWKTTAFLRSQSSSS